MSVALLGYGFKVAHTAYTKRAFELADVVSDAPCFCDYQQLDVLFPGSKFVYLERALELWVPSMQMLLKKMLAQLDFKTGYLNPVLKRCFNDTFALSVAEQPLSKQHLEDCYRKHRQGVINYFNQRENLLTINISQKNSLTSLLHFLNITDECINDFPKLNVGKQVDSWKNFKHHNKINALAAGKEHKKFFDYT